MPDHGKIAHLFLARVDSDGVLRAPASGHARRRDASPPAPTAPGGSVSRLRRRRSRDGIPAHVRRLFPDVAAPCERTRASRSATTPGSRPALCRVVHPLRGWATRSRSLVGRHAAGRRTDRACYDSCCATPTGGAGDVEPYLGMTGHAVVMRRDGKVYVHLHPERDRAMASEEAFALRDRGDTLSTTESQALDAMRMTTAQGNRCRDRLPVCLSERGRYRVWVQLRSRQPSHRRPST